MEVSSTHTSPVREEPSLIVPNTEGKVTSLQSRRRQRGLKRRSRDSRARPQRPGAADGVRGMYGRSSYPEKRRRLGNSCEQRDAWTEGAPAAVPNTSDVARAATHASNPASSPVFGQHVALGNGEQVDRTRSSVSHAFDAGRSAYQPPTSQVEVPHMHSRGLPGSDVFSGAREPNPSISGGASTAQNAILPALPVDAPGTGLVMPYLEHQRPVVANHATAGQRQVPDSGMHIPPQTTGIHLPPIGLPHAAVPDGRSLPFASPCAYAGVPAGGAGPGSSVDSVLLGFGILPTAIGSGSGGVSPSGQGAGRGSARSRTAGGAVRNAWGTSAGPSPLRPGGQMPVQQEQFSSAQFGRAVIEAPRIPPISTLATPRNDVGTRAASSPHAMQQQLQSHLDDVGSNFPTEHTNVAASRGATRQTQPLRLGQIPSVVEALNRVPDASPVLRALHDLVKSNQASHSPQSPLSPRHASVGTYRTTLFSFTGFPATVHPDPAILTALSKSDLDLIARMFQVKLSRSGGTKADTARRIILYLKKPIFWLPGRDVSGASSTPVVGQSRARRTHVRDTGGSAGRHGSRSNGTVPPSSGSVFKRLGPATSPATRATSSTFDFSSARRGATTTSNGLPGRRGGHIVDLVSSHNFLDPETPFNVPLGPPLGTVVRVVYFDARQLSQGYEPTLAFSTPAPRQATEGAEVQVHLRCLKVEMHKPIGQWTQHWPFPASAKINGNSIELNQAQRYTSGKLAGVDMPTNITAYLRKYKPSVQVENNAVLRRHEGQATPAPGHFVLFVQEVSVVSNELLRKQVIEESDKYWEEHFTRQRAKRASKALCHSLQSVLDEGLVISRGDEVSGTDAGELPESAISNFELAKEAVVQFMNADEGLTSCSMRVSLRCPLSLTRIQVPVKGKKCHHIQCFDLENYLSFTRRTPKFSCPVCNTSGAMPKELVVSPYMREALKMFSCDEVEIASDGTMSAVEHQPTGVRSDDDDDDDDAGICKDDDRDPLVNGMAFGSGGNICASNTVVDLTLSDEDDDQQQGEAPKTDEYGLNQKSNQADGAHGGNFVDGESSVGSESLGGHAASRPVADPQRDRALGGEEAHGYASENSGGQTIYPPTDQCPRTGASVRDLLDELVEPELNQQLSCDVIALDSD